MIIFITVSGVLSRWDGGLILRALGLGRRANSFELGVESLGLMWV